MGTAPPARASSNPRRGPARLDNVRGLGDVRGDGDDDDDDDKPQEWYTGGAQSGSVVQDPKKKPSRVEDILDGARAAGAVDGTADDLNPSASDNPNTAGGGARRTAFSGSGRTLGGNGRESTAVGVPPDAASAEGGALNPSAPTPTPTSHVITFWTNGFTVDAGGELRRYDDPANAPFMQAVANGQCPPELAPEDRNQPININLVRKETEYEPPPEPKYRAFQGSGRTLGGSSSGGAVGGAVEGAVGGAATAAAGPSSDAAAEGSGAGAWSVDEGAPTTSVQLRLRDGSRVVGRFNLTHTVADVRAFIACASPANASGTYSLQLSGFPPKRLEDEAQAVGDGLANSVIIQR